MEAKVVHRFDQLGDHSTNQPALSVGGLARLFHRLPIVTLRALPRGTSPA